MFKFPFRLIALLSLCFTVAACAGPAPTATPTPVPTATPRPTPVIIGTAELLGTTDPQEVALWQMWRGLETNDQPIRFGVSLKMTLDQANQMLLQDANNFAANWVSDHIKVCVNDNNAMIIGNYQNPAEANVIIAASTRVIDQCNPRIFEAYARRRWAQIALWTAADPIAETRAPQLLAGLTIHIGAKSAEPLPFMQSQDQVQITIEGILEFGLDFMALNLSSRTLDVLLGLGQWAEGDSVTVPGDLFPYNPPEPLLPANAQVTPTP